MFKSLLARLQIVLPTLLLTRIAGLVAGSRIVWLKNTMIRCFSKAYRINWEEIEADSASEFASFNEFFSRPLRPDARSFQAAPGKLAEPLRRQHRCLWSDCHEPATAAGQGHQLSAATFAGLCCR